MGKKGQNQKKKNTITFRLVGRSQQDPLINYDDAPQAVLVEQKKPKDRKAEQRKYGIYYDDDYDYMQHLKGCEEVEEEYYFEEFDPKGTRVKEIKPKDEIEKEKDIIKLPSSVFPSQYQESVGMLNKGVLPTGPRPDWDQDVVGALMGLDHDEDDNEVPYDYESKDNELDDDFVVQAMGGEIKLRDDASDDELNDELDFVKRKVQFEDDDQFEDASSSDRSDDRHTIRTVGSRTEFTNYSLTSSVIRRNEKLNDLDEHFETFFLKDIVEEEDEADDSSDEEPDGKENEILNGLISEHQTERNKSEFNTDDVPKKAILRIAERQLQDEEENREELEEIELKLATGKNEYEDRWDCQSILSNYSNIYNRPKSILEERTSKKIRINEKTGMPEQDRLTGKGLKELNKQADDQQTIRSMTSLISQLSMRNKDESKEEKQLRKKNLKEFMRERRQEKKANKLAFKEMNQEMNHQKVVNRQLAALKF